MIENKPKKYIGDYSVDAVRAAYENRARWYYFLVKEGLEQGLPLQFARDAMREAGHHLGKGRFAHVTTPQEFADEFMTHSVQTVNEGVAAKITDTEFVAEVHYCPLVNAWKQLTDDEEFMAEICDVCMDMDRGTAEALGWEMDLLGTIAGGCDRCTMCFKKK